MSKAEDIPKKGKGGVVVNEGKDFHVEVQEIDVPECSKRSKRDALSLCLISSRGR